ncbi:MAG: hypothetical protein NZM06_02675 [Chloroherpetonaceae bacterium]|nr:hypothetical protein [Chloroherpetonaceae bacterium]MDW8436610.1 hypothetical protein [Chloroherpetonaceae bacterium]
MDLLANAAFGFLSFLFIYRFSRYLTTPFFKRIGLYRYYSKMFFTSPYGFKTLEVHVGTSWDFFRLQKVNPTILLRHLAEGLHNLCLDIESGKIAPDTKIRGNLYYFSDATVRKFGFKSRRPNLFEWILFSLNYVELCLLLSISYGRLAFVRFENLKVIEGKASELARYKDDYRRVAERLRRRDPSQSAQLILVERSEATRNVA